MAGYVDLHSHWIPGVDDGVPSVDEGIALLRALSAAGFERVIATPHMRPGMFDNERKGLEAAYEEMVRHVASSGVGVQVGLGCEHFF
ncbi:MAG: protein tyrosine phosphatase, partial [Deltaproteobacteria bacterium HGW-Deltaproteobacteria-20]